MSKKQRGNRKRSVATLAELFDQLAPDEFDEASEELRALGIDPSAAAGRLEHVALRSIREPRPARARRVNSSPLVVSM